MISTNNNSFLIFLKRLGIRFLLIELVIMNNVHIFKTVVQTWIYYQSYKTQAFKFEL